jgi:protease-4
LIIDFDPVSGKDQVFSGTARDQPVPAERTIVRHKIIMRRLRNLLPTVLVPVLVAGCIGEGVLLTPVSTRRDLVETEMYRESLFATDKIALIDVSGILTNSPRWQFWGEGEHPVSLLLEQLDKARRDRRVRAVVLRINSPGGTVGATELMHDEVKWFRETTGKPVVAVTMDVAASGAYYIACACNEIVAQPSSVLGSIGVIMQMFDVSGTMHKIGVKSEAVVSGPRKDAGSPFRTMTPEERALFQGIVNDMHRRFVDVVAAGRPDLDRERVQAIADGRVYTASQARELGLIDRIATLRDTIAAVKRQVGAKKIRLVAYKRPFDYRPNFYAAAPHGGAAAVNLLNVNVSDWTGNTAPRFMYVWSP